MAKDTDSTVDEELEDSELDVDDESQDEIDEEETDESDSEEETDETDDEDESEDDDDDESEDDEEEDEDDQPKFEKRYTQIKGDTPQEYIKNLEKTYKNSTDEALRLKGERDTLQRRVDQMAEVIAKNPEIAEQIQDTTQNPLVAPELLHARQTMEDQMRTEFAEFTEEHPELATDSDLQAKVLKRLKVLGDASRNDDGRILGMREGLDMAWISLGLNKGNDEETVRLKAKENASRSKTSGGGKKAPKGAKVEFSEAQIATGMNMGLGKTRKEVIEKLKKYAT